MCVLTSNGNMGVGLVGAGQQWRQLPQSDPAPSPSLLSAPAGLCGSEKRCFRRNSLGKALVSYKIVLSIEQKGSCHLFV